MTGGTVVVLGDVGRNFAAGMTGEPPMCSMRTISFPPGATPSTCAGNGCAVQPQYAPLLWKVAPPAGMVERSTATAQPAVAARE